MTVGSTGAGGPDRVRRAVVVGSGPNGLVGACILARAGLAVTVLEAADHPGGGTHSQEAILPGLVHDHCSAFHPLAVGSPALHELDLAARGLQWARAEIDCAHPLDGGREALLYRDVETTAAGLGSDGSSWSRLFGGPSRRFDAVASSILGPLLSTPGRPVSLAAFGARTIPPATVLARSFTTEEARALWMGVAAHALTKLDGLLSSAVGTGIIAAGHRHGWPVAVGGSVSIANALVSDLEAHGGHICTGVRVRSRADVEPADIVLWDVSPRVLVSILGDGLPSSVRSAFVATTAGPGAYKVDLAVEGGVPWASLGARRAATVHVGGTADEVVAAERDVLRGRMPGGPFVLVGQQYLADPTRSVGDIHPVWTYAHVPHGYDGDATDVIIDRIARFAPGLRQRIVGMRVTRPADFEASNPNFAGGDFLTGASGVRRLLTGARATPRPYDIGIPGHFLCSAATPPGPGAHGMCGLHAARRALSQM